MSQKETGILCQNVWKIFGPNPENIYPLAGESINNQEILEPGREKATLFTDEPVIAPDHLPPAFKLDPLPPAFGDIKKAVISATYDLTIELKEDRLQSVVDLLSFFCHSKFLSCELYS